MREKETPATAITRVHTGETAADGCCSRAYNTTAYTSCQTCAGGAE